MGIALSGGLVLLAKYLIPRRRSKNERIYQSELWPPVAAAGMR